MVTEHSISHIRRRAVATLGKPTTLEEAIARLGFIQADPIKAPAAAQDLILWHRVVNYCTGQLDREYPSLPVEEDNFYSYGFLWRELWRLMHPRSLGALSALEMEVLAAVTEAGEAHPRDLARAMGKGRMKNDWGGISQATKIGLEHLHRRGLLRVVRREQGIRIYGPARLPEITVEPAERVHQIAMTVARSFEPVHQTTFSELLSRIRHSAPGLPSSRAMISQLMASGALQRVVVDGQPYLCCGDASDDRNVQDEPRVRFLAPFDPIVWDRRRFEHIWGWAYRFEAYVPASRRVRGYYALPLLWKDVVIGWVNISLRDGAIEVEKGFAREPPTDGSFKTAVDMEVERMNTFMRCKL